MGNNTTEAILEELKAYGNDGTKKVFLNHGAREPLFGVRVQDLKKIQKRIRKHHELSMELYNTGNSDAMYLAGLIADKEKISKNDRNAWAREANWHMISECTVAWIAAESPYGYELGLDWIESDKEHIASAGWSTLSNYASITDDADLDIDVYQKLLKRIEQNIHKAPNRVRYTMNGFVIAVGSYIKSLTERASEAAGNIGKVSVDMGGTACKVPLAKDYIQKVIDKGYLGRKRKKARC